MSVIDLGTCPFFDDTHTERLEGYGEFYHAYEFSIPSNHASAEFAVPKGYVIFPDLDGDMKMFTIKTVDEESGIDGLYKHCFAEDTAQEELNCSVITPVSYEDETVADLAATILDSTKWNAGVIEASTTTLVTHDFSEYETVWEAVCWLAKEQSLEINTRVITQGSRIVERYIDLLRTRGTYSGQIIEYSRDTTAITRSGDGGEIYSACYGFGADSGGIPLNFSSQVWVVANGDPVEKPAGQLWVRIDSAREQYGITLDSGTVIDRMGVFRDSEETDEHKLLHKTYDYLLKHSIPQYTYDVSIAALERMPSQRPGDAERSWEEIRVGDTVTVKDTAVYPPYSDEVRVVEVRRSYSDPTKDGLVLGEPKKKFSDYFKMIVKMQRELNI